MQAESHGAGTLAIVNPKAGGGASHAAFRRAEHALMETLGDVDVLFTKAPGDAERMTREALVRGVGHVVIAGGDGTVHEAVNGWFGEDGRPWHDDAVLVVLPGGTGSDFCRTLGIRGPDDTLEIVRRGSTRRIDVGRVTVTELDSSEEITRVFANVASFGLSGLVDRHAGTFSVLGGRMAYAAATALALWGWRNPRVRLAIRDAEGVVEVDAPVALVAVANGRFFGGGMEIAPGAALDDGRFEVTVLGDVRRREVLRMSKTIYAGEHTSHPQVLNRPATTVEADSDETVLMDVDGEAIGRLPARFEVIPSALTVAAA